MIVRRFRSTEIIACLFVVVFVIAVISSSFYMYRMEQALKGMPPKIVRQDSKSQPSIPNRYFLGSKEAKVKIEAFLPFEVDCHMVNIGVLLDVVKLEGKRLRLELYNMHSLEGSKAMEKRDIHCASILINGEIFSSGPRADVFGLLKKIDESLKKAYGNGVKGKDMEHLKARWMKVSTQEAAERVRQFFAPGAFEEKLKGILIAKPTDKVEVVFYMPPKDMPGATNFPEAIKRVEALKRQYGERLTIKIIDMTSDEAIKARMEGRIQGPCVLVNGSYKHLVKVDGESMVIRLDAEPLARRFIDPDKVETAVKAYLGVSAK